MVRFGSAHALWLECIPACGPIAGFSVHVIETVTVCHILQAKSAELSEARQKIAELSEAQIKHMSDMAATLSKMDERESELNVCRQLWRARLGSRAQSWLIHH